MTTPQQEITDRVRQRVREDRAALGRAEALPADVARIAAAEVRRHNDRALAAGGRAVEDSEAAVREIVAAVSGYGPLQPLLDDDEIEEIWINRPSRAAKLILDKGRPSCRTSQAASHPFDRMHLSDDAPRARRCETAG
ncbi:hypothetical protein [Microbacterium excoecariae]|uniref:hypothetical protein n=1 Tax=Microbacterium excoecariae TaxID=2715210 RepID=UPI00140B2F27|nr:hypothetical protein [Microbacterium excoecariae]NHI17269.1 hypothetical protein [Microbacterium excoecariae]